MGKEDCRICGKQNVGFFMVLLLQKWNKENGVGIRSLTSSFIHITTMRPQSYVTKFVT